MNFHVTQSIHIHSIKIDTISNSSVFQIGSSGIIKPLSTSAQPRGSKVGTGKPDPHAFQITAPPKSR